MGGAGVVPPVLLGEAWGINCVWRVSAVTCTIRRYVRFWGVGCVKVRSVHGVDEPVGWRLPVAIEAVPAGFPSPAQDYFSGDLDLNEHLLSNRTSTYIMRVSGHSMNRAGIFHGDLLLVDSALEPKDGQIVIAVLDGERTVKRLRVTGGGVVLSAENPAYPDIRVAELSQLEIWGVVTWCLHDVRRV